MTGPEIADCLRRTPSYVSDIALPSGARMSAEDQAACAKSAFLINLLGRLGIETDPSGESGRSGALLDRLLALLRGHRRAVPGRVVRRAHCDMVLPMTRAIISSLLYGEGVSVTPLGVPKSYGAA